MTEREAQQLAADVKKIKEEFEDLKRKLKWFTDTSYMVSGREIINREIQFLQKVYDKSGNLVGEINT